MRTLLEQGADINIQDEKNKDTPLHRSIWYGRFEVFKLLLEKGADVQKKNKYGNMPIHFAAMYGKTDMINCLLEKGADIHSQGAFGDTPLHRAAFNDRLDIVQLLLEKGARVNETNNIGHTALHEAAGQGHPAVARILIENGAKINVKDIQGKTALHAASYHAKIPVINILLEAGADVNIINRHDETAIDLAANEEVKQLLLSYQGNNSGASNDPVGSRPSSREPTIVNKQSSSPQQVHPRPGPKGTPPESAAASPNKTPNSHNNMGGYSRNLIVESPRVAQDYESDAMNDTNQRILMLERENRFLNAQIKQLRGEEIEHFSLEDLHQLKQYQEIALYNTQQQINRTISMMSQPHYSGSSSNYPYSGSSATVSFSNQSSSMFMPNRGGSPISASSSRSNSYDRLLTSTLPMTSQAQLSSAIRSKSYTNVPSIPNTRQLSSTPKSKSFESVAAAVQNNPVGSGSSPDSSSGENRRKSSLTNRSTNDLFGNSSFPNLENFLSDAFRPLDLEPSRYVQTDPQNSFL